MSGGSYDYLCYKIEDASKEIQSRNDNGHRAAFAQLLKLVAKAMHDIEWVDSCDYGKKDEIEAIIKCFKYFLNKKDMDLLERKIDIYDELNLMKASIFEAEE